MKLYARDARSLTLGEKFLMALTALLAVATVALAVAGSARAGLGGALPGDGPYTCGPATAVSHAESIPGDPAALH
ncbi:MAG TPA: hypothetical protein VLS25_13310 [Dehalococcoidia bacterium]|nr:hypothetical protein [Dehalococcoidia bacterium]